MSILTIGVLMGGRSIEREVSFNTGRTICDHLDTTRYKALPLFQTIDNRLFILPWKFLHRGKISDFEHRLATEAQEIKWDDLKTLVDFIYIALHGRYGEDGCAQGFLELLTIPYMGTKILGSALGMNKAQQKKWLTLHGIRVPHGIVLHPHQVDYYVSTFSALQELLEANNLNFPLVVKPSQEGSSLGVTVVFDINQLAPALIAACNASNERKQPLLIEERIEGMEFTCITLFNKKGDPIFLPPTEVLYEKGFHLHGYEQKYMPGRSIKFTPARCDEKTIKNIQLACLETARILDFKTMARIDGFVQKDGTIIIVDPNTLSGMAPSAFIFNQAAEIDMSPTELINHLITTEIESSLLK